MRSAMAKEARQFQGHLGGVIIIALQAIPIGGGKSIPAGTDVTEEAKNWPNLPGMIKRGTVKCTPEVNTNTILRGPPPTNPAELEKLKESGKGLFMMSQEELDGQKTPPAKVPVAAPKTHLLFIQSRGYTVDTDEGAAKFRADMPPEQQASFDADFAAWVPPPPALAQSTLKPVPGTIPASPALPPGVLGRGIALRLRDLTDKDSSKHIQNTLKEAGGSAGGSKKEMLAVRDQLLAESAAKEAEAINAARVVDKGMVEADAPAVEDAPPAGGEPPAP